MSWKGFVSKLIQPDAAGLNKFYSKYGFQKFSIPTLKICHFFVNVFSIPRWWKQSVRQNKTAD